MLISLSLLALARKETALWIQGDIFRAKLKEREADGESVSKVLSSLDDVSITGTLNKTEMHDRYGEVKISQQLSFNIDNRAVVIK